MKVSTSRFGELEIDDRKIITIPDGMIGFTEQKFILLNPEKGGPFCWFQSVENPSLAFVVVDPVQFMPDYQVKLTQSEYNTLKLGDKASTVLLAVVTMASDPRLITMNLQGPIVLNPDSMIAMQIVMDGNYNTWHRLFDFPKSQESAVVAKNPVINRSIFTMTTVRNELAAVPVFA